MVGQRVSARVLQAQPKKHQLDLSLLPPTVASCTSAASAAQAPQPGALVMGRVVAAAGTGVRVRLGAI